MSGTAAFIVVASWQSNDYDVLQRSVSHCSSVSFVVVPLGDNEIVLPDGVLRLTWTDDAMLKNLAQYDITSFPHCIILNSDGTTLQSSANVISTVPLVDDVDYFAQAIEAYNNFDLFNAVSK